MHVLTLEDVLAIFEYRTGQKPELNVEQRLKKAVEDIALESHAELVSYLFSVGATFGELSLLLACDCLFIAAARNGMTFTSRVDLEIKLEAGLLRDDIVALITYENPIPDPWWK